jgi:hypothetical protein
LLQLIECLKAREAELAAHGLVVDQQQKDKMKDIYLV